MYPQDPDNIFFVASADLDGGRRLLWDDFFQEVLNLEINFITVYLCISSVNTHFQSFKTSKYQFYNKIF